MYAVTFLFIALQYSMFNLWANFQLVGAPSGCGRLTKAFLFGEYGRIGMH